VRPELLLHGIDTLQCSYFLRPHGHSGIDFAGLTVEREKLRQSKERESKLINLGGVDFLLSPHGSPLGFPLVLNNQDFRIEMGEYNNPPFFVTFRSQALWRDGAPALHQKFLEWAARLVFRPYKPESLTRVDFAFDYLLDNIDFDEDFFVSYSNKDSQHRENGKIQTFTFGRSDIVLRVYDKVAEIKQESDKVWFYDLWEREDNVWRIEWQVRKQPLKRFGIATLNDLEGQPGDLLRYLAEQHDTLRVPSGDGNRSRWPLHPLWQDLHERIRELKSLGVYRVVDEAPVLSARKMRIGIAMYGYLKQLAAIRCIQQGKELISIDDAQETLKYTVNKLHDPLSWRIDVQKRIKSFHLGQW